MRVSPAAQGRSSRGKRSLRWATSVSIVGVSGVSSACAAGTSSQATGVGDGHAHGLDVRGIPAARAVDVGVLAVLGRGEELLALAAAHGAGHRLDDDVVEAEAVEDADVGVAVQLVALVEPGGVDVEGVGVLHDELAPAQHAGTRTRLVAVLRLDLVDRQRQVLVGAVEVLDREGEHLLVGRAEQVVGALAVLEAEDVVAVLGPAAARLEGLLGQQRGEEQLLGADGVHLLADDALDVAQHAQAEGQPGVDAGADAADVAGAGRAAGGSAPRHRPGPREGFAGTGTTCAGPRDLLQGVTEPPEDIGRAVPVSPDLPVGHRGGPEGARDHRVGRSQRRPAARSAVRISGSWRGSRASVAANAAREAASCRRVARWPWLRHIWTLPG